MVEAHNERNLFCGFVHSLFLQLLATLTSTTSVRLYVFAFNFLPRVQGGESILIHSLCFFVVVCIFFFLCGKFDFSQRFVLVLLLALFNCLVSLACFLCILANHSATPLVALLLSTILCLWFSFLSFVSVMPACMAMSGRSNSLSFCLSSRLFTYHVVLFLRE